jgi:hypothetical protein
VCDLKGERKYYNSNEIGNRQKISNKDISGPEPGKVGLAILSFRQTIALQLGIMGFFSNH